MNNIYYNPEDCGLSIVGVLDEDGLSYEFNTLLVVKETSSKRLFYATSSGCSCPTPFEEYHFSNGDDHDLTEIKGENVEAFVNEVNNFPASQDERRQLVTKVRRQLRSSRS